MTNLDKLAEAGKFFGVHMTTKLESGRWCATFRRERLPSRTGEPMFDPFFGQTPTEAIENGAKALLDQPDAGSEAAEAIDELI